MAFIQVENRDQFQFMSLATFISQDDKSPHYIRISIFKNTIFQSLLSDRQFFDFKIEKTEINSKNGYKSQSDSYRTDGLRIGIVRALLQICSLEDRNDFSILNY